MNNRPTITIPAPKFEQYQLVIVYWNDQEHVTQTVRRWLIWRMVAGGIKFKAWNNFFLKM